MKTQILKQPSTNFLELPPLSILFTLHRELAEFSSDSFYTPQQTNSWKNTTTNYFKVYHYNIIKAYTVDSLLQITGKG